MTAATTHTGAPLLTPSRRRIVSYLIARRASRTSPVTLAQLQSAAAATPDDVRTLVINQLLHGDTLVGFWLTARGVDEGTPR